MLIVCGWSVYFYFTAITVDLYHNETN